MKDRQLKSFEHGPAFVTLSRENDKYIVNLYLNNSAGLELNPTPSNSYETTVLDDAMDIYSQTCRQVVLNY